MHRSPASEPPHYWRGPVGLIVKHMIADGLACVGQGPIAERIVVNSVDLIGKGGSAEYDDPQTAATCGRAHYLNGGNGYYRVSGGQGV